jgi:hypothetical protein
LALIDELRRAHRRAKERERTLSGLAEGADDYRAIRERFYRHTGRFGPVGATLKEKERREASRLLGFLLERAQLPAKWIAIGDRPDFRFSLGRRRIGMELVEAILPHPKDGKGRGSVRKEQERLQDQIVERALQIHTAAGGTPLRVHVSFSAASDFRKSEIEQAAQTLASLVPLQLKRERHLPDARTIGAWPKWLIDVHAARRPKVVRDLARWDVAHGGYVAAAETVLPALIREKESKLPDYRQSGCDEYWLLIYVDGTTTASFMSLNDRLSLFRTQFDQVFLYSPMFGDGTSVVRLNCHP